MEKLIVKNPEVTLEVEAHGLPEEARDNAALDRSGLFDVGGDDGRRYWIDYIIGSHRSLGGFAGQPWKAMDLWCMGVSWERGKVVQPRGSAYKIADFPQVTAIAWHTYKGGTLTIKRSEHEVAIDLGDFHLISKDDKTWHYSVEDKEKGIKLELVHTGAGFPTWYYDKEKPHAFTPHCRAGGYFWSGRVAGTLTIKGRKVGIKGKGVRENYYAWDVCSAEVGGWHDWVWFHFDEMFGSIDEMKLSKSKIMSLNIVEGTQYFSAGSFNIEHNDWAYLPTLGAFIPTRYKVTISTEAGVLEMATKVVGCQLWGTTGEVPDAPSQVLHWDKLDGTFTYKDGRKRKLTNGRGGTFARLWKPYPSINTIIPELADIAGKVTRHMPT